MEEREKKLNFSQQCSIIWIERIGGIRKERRLNKGKSCVWIDIEEGKWREKRRVI